MSYNVFILNKTIMKYIITENKLNDIIFKYLDIKYGALEQKEYIIIFHFHNEDQGELTWKHPNELFISRKLRNEVSNFFGLDNYDSIKVIGEWFEDRYNLKVSYIPNPDDVNGKIFWIKII